MRPGILFVLVFLLASVACSQELRFVYPVPAPTDFARSNLVYKKSGQTGLSLDFFLPTHSAHSKPLPVFVIFNGFGRGFMRTSAQSQGWAKAATAHGFAAITAETTADRVAEDQALTDSASSAWEHKGTQGNTREHKLVHLWPDHLSGILPLRIEFLVGTSR